MNQGNTYNPYSGNGYQRSAYPSYGQNYGTDYNYANYNQNQYENTTSTSDTRGSYSTSWDFTQPPPNVTSNSSGNQEDAVAHEMKQQKAQLHKQREDYVKKLIVLRRELELLRNQKHELVGSSSPPRDLDSIVKENEKLQDEIQTKMKAITNVIEMLSSIIKDGLTLSDLENQLREDTPKKKRTSKSPSLSVDTHLQFNYVHYDPELHWCRMCDIFPKTAKEFLLHLQSKKHQENIQDNDVGDNTPWHKLSAEVELPHYEGAPKKRIPIKGLQFFISAPSWYCKLCDVWIGDLHCASQHLKSQVHFQNYQNFVEQNPHWEMEWLKDREKAQSRSDKRGSSDSDDSSMSKRKKKKKEKKGMEPTSKDKKKKKKGKKHKRHSSDSSSSSSSSASSSDNEADDKSRSIRVAMRNVKVESIMQEDLTGKWEMLGRLVEEHKKKTQQEEKLVAKQEPANDNLINQWMTVHEPPAKEKYLLDSLKDRMKQKHTIEKAKYLEIEKRQKERELREREELERRQIEEKEAFEQRENERKEQERLEYERILNKERSQVKFKPTFREKQYRRNASPSPSPESHREREREPERREHERDRHREYERSKRDKRRSPSPVIDSPSKYKRYSRDKSGHSRSRSRSRSKGSDRRPQKSQEKTSDKKPPGPPMYKKLPFIGRMPLFKNKKPDDKVEKEIQKEEYDKPRQTRFEPGNLPRAFIPEPDVVCFPKLSSYPELIMPPVVLAPKKVTPPPPAPKITEAPKKAPPPPKIDEKKQKEAEFQRQEQQFQFRNEEFDPNLYEDPSQLWGNSRNNFETMYPPMFPSFMEPLKEPDTVPISHMMPLQPPPMPPGEDELALLGISADDMAAQTF